MVLLVCGTGILILGLNYFLTRDSLRAQIDSTALSIAVTAASLLDGDLHQKINQQTQITDEAWVRTENILKYIRRVNQRDDVYIKYIFTLIPDPVRPGEMAFAVDTIDPGVEYGKPGESYMLQENAKRITMGIPMVQPGFVTDKWGTFLEAYAPIKNSAGETVAMLGVNIDAKEVQSRLRKLMIQGLGAMLVGLVIGLLAATLFSNSIAGSISQIVQAVQEIGSGNLNTRLEITGYGEFNAVAESINKMAKGLKERENLKGSLARYVSSHVAENILSSGELAQLSGERRIITIMFTDVRGFTSLSEKMSPEDVVMLLNEYFESMIDIVFKHNGTLDKFIGDGMMVMFGAPVPDENHASNAIRAALKMRDEMEKLALKFQKEKNLNLNIGIGIHTGPAVVGNIGSNQRMQYTAIGDTVNLAARVEASTKEFGVDILVSQDAKMAGNNPDFRFEKLRDISVKGRETPVMVYSVNYSASDNLKC